jgi:hypothetical protein
MKKTIFNFLLLTLLFISCNKSTSSGGKSVEYQVTATNYSQITVAYNNENEQYVSGSYQSGWKYTFTTTKKPFTTLVRAISLSSSVGTLTTTCTIKILVDGVVVKTESLSNATAADVTAQYVIQ